MTLIFAILVVAAAGMVGAYFLGRCDGYQAGWHKRQEKYARQLMAAQGEIHRLTMMLSERGGR